jgi:hypothetical protein
LMKYVTKMLADLSAVTLSWLARTCRRRVNQSLAYIYNSLTAESSEYASCLVK